MTVVVPEGAKLHVRWMKEDGSNVTEPVLTTSDLERATTELWSHFNQSLSDLKNYLEAKMNVQFSNTTAATAQLAGRVAALDLATAGNISNVRGGINSNRAEIEIGEQHLNRTVEQLNAGFNTVNSSLDSLREDLTLAWPPLETFSSDAEGWSGTSTARATCGHTGTFLGGYGQLGQGATISKIYKLPPHNGVRIQLNIMAVDSWNGETAEIRVDGDLIWSKPLGPSTSDGQISRCDVGGNLRVWAEKVDVTLATHSTEMLRIEVTSDMSKAATDQSFGIDNVLITRPYQHFPPMDTFDGESMEGWSGTGFLGAKKFSNCGSHGVILVSV